MNQTTPKIEVKNIKHIYTDAELIALGGDLARKFSELRGIESEFDQVKASYKAKTTECEARIDALSTSRTNGFDMRNERCAVIYNPADREKYYVLESELTAHEGDYKKCVVQLTERMTPDDFQADLIQAESKFDSREEIQLFQPTETDRGVLVVGRFAGKWFSALRVKIGKLELNERLDSEQRSVKFRHMCVALGVRRVKEWAKEHLKEHAKGFEDQFASVVEAHKEREE